MRVVFISLSTNWLRHHKLCYIGLGMNTDFVWIPLLSSYHLSPSSAYDLLSSSSSYHLSSLHNHTIIIIPYIIIALSYHVSSFNDVITGQSSESPDQTEQPQWISWFDQDSHRARLASSVTADGRRWASSGSEIVPYHNSYFMGFDKRRV